MLPAPVECSVLVRKLSEKDLFTLEHIRVHERSCSFYALETADSTKASLVSRLPMNLTKLNLTQHSN